MKSPTSLLLVVQVIRRQCRSRLQCPVRSSNNKTCVCEASAVSAVNSLFRSASTQKTSGRSYYNKGGNEMSSSWSPSSRVPMKESATRLVSVDLRDNETGEITTLQRNRNALYDVDFGNHSEAFRKKTTWELVRALCVLKMCGVDAFVNNSLTLFKWTRRILGRPGLRMLVKPTFYKQFVGGETHREIQECMGRLSETGIRPMLAATMEEDIGDPEKNEDIYNSNCSRILECMELATAEATPSPMMQLKMTGIIPADLVVKLGEIYNNNEDKLELVKDISQNFSTVDSDLKLEKIAATLDENDVNVLKKSLLRLQKIAEEAKARGIKILVDAEYTYMNSGLSLLTLAMQATYNQDSPMIWNTYQCYLKDTYDKVCRELSLTDTLGVHFGAKLVRGAYVQQERARSQSMKTTCQVCDDYNATNKNYNNVLGYLLEEAKKDFPKRRSFIIATHNSESIKFAIEKMKELNIDQQKGGVCFGQLYGMSDDITYPLAISGYAVYKSIPYGTLDEVLPYLVRRAIENRAVLAGLRNEKSVIWKEMKLRLGKSRNRT